MQHTNTTVSAPPSVSTIQQTSKPIKLAIAIGGFGTMIAFGLGVAAFAQHDPALLGWSILTFTVSAATYIGGRIWRWWKHM